MMHFNATVKRQTNGTAMGSPMAPPDANIFMYRLERHTILQWKHKKGRMLYKRFIDHILAIFKPKES